MKTKSEILTILRSKSPEAVALVQAMHASGASGVDPEIMAEASALARELRADEKPRLPRA